MAAIEFSSLTAGGPMVWVLLAIGVIGITLTVERALYLHRGQIRARDFMSGIKNILAKRRLVEALTVCEETPGPVAAITKAALLHADDEAEALRFQVQEAALVELPALERRLGFLAAIAQVAPLVGLLGTGLGMITTFIAFQSDYTKATVLADGMWQALVSTAGGLAIAIPAHLAYHFLSGRVRAIVGDMEWAGNEIMRYLLTDYRGKPPAGSAEQQSEGGGHADPAA
jgi:biopolymer transport protein ExbB